MGGTISIDMVWIVVIIFGVVSLFAKNQFEIARLKKDVAEIKISHEDLGKDLRREINEIGRDIQSMSVALGRIEGTLNIKK
jgi:hypothetical protein